MKTRRRIPAVTASGAKALGVLELGGTSFMITSSLFASLHHVDTAPDSAIFKAGRSLGTRSHKADVIRSYISYVVQREVYLRRDGVVPQVIENRLYNAREKAMDETVQEPQEQNAEEMKKAPRGVRGYIRSLLQQGVGQEEALGKAREAFPGSKVSVGDVRGQMRHLGMIDWTARKGVKRERRHGERRGAGDASGN